MSQILLHEITPEQFKELFLEAYKETFGKKPDQNGSDFSSYDFKGASLKGATFVYSTLNLLLISVEQCSQSGLTVS